MLQVPNLVKSDLVFNERLTEFSVDIYIFNYIHHIISNFIIIRLQNHSDNLLLYIPDLLQMLLPTSKMYLQPHLSVPELLHSKTDHSHLPYKQDYVKKVLGFYRLLLFCGRFMVSLYNVSISKKAEDI